MATKKESQAVAEKVNDLEVFFLSDLYTLFRPEHQIPSGKNGKMEKWYRQDTIKDEQEFASYISTHFSILRKEIKKILEEKDDK